MDVVLVGVDEGVPGDRGPDDRLDRLLPDIGQHPQRHPPAALDQAEDRRLVLRQRAAARRSRQPTTPPERAPFSDRRRLALVSGCDLDLVDLHLAFQRRRGGPGRQAVRMASAAPLSGWMRPKNSKYAPARGWKVNSAKSRPWWMVAR